MFPDIDIEWRDRTLAGFESQKLADLVEIYDLIIYDHPFSGDVAAADLFLSLDEHMGPLPDALFVARNAGLYRYSGKQWGLPIDAATQHAIVRHDLIEALAESVPTKWDEVVALGERLRRRGLYLGSAFAKPHAGLLIAALMTNQGAPWWDATRDRMRIDRTVLLDALARVATLARLCPPDALGWDAIDLHEAMVARDDVVYAPCVYGYATYGEADQRRRLGWADFAGPRAPHHVGTAIGGTGLAISARTKHVDAALAFMRFMTSEVAQDEIIPRHHGQPVLRSIWDTLRWDDAYNGYYSGVRRTLDDASVRPRVAGYIGFQDRAGALVEAFLRGEGTSAEVADAIVSASRAVERG